MFVQDLTPLYNAIDQTDDPEEIRFINDLVGEFKNGSPLPVRLYKNREAESLGPCAMIMKALQEVVESVDEENEKRMARLALQFESHKNKKKEFGVINLRSTFDDTLWPNGTSKGKGKKIFFY